MNVVRAKTIDEVVAGFHSEIGKISSAILDKMSLHTNEMISAYYTDRVQAENYPLRNPQTKEIMDSMPPVEIAKHIRRDVDADSAVVYVPPGTPADRSARMQELFGGKPWQVVRNRMQDLDYINRTLPVIGLPGLRAKPIV